MVQLEEEVAELVHACHAVLGFAVAREVEGLELKVVERGVQEGLVL